jgi:hypothetical protein
MLLLAAVRRISVAETRLGLLTSSTLTMCKTHVTCQGLRACSGTRLVLYTFHLGRVLNAAPRRSSSQFRCGNTTWPSHELYANNVQDTCDMSGTACVFRDEAGTLNVSPWESAKCCSSLQFVAFQVRKHDLAFSRALR